MTDTKLEHQLTTRQFANLNGVEASAVHARVCLKGDYFGIKPIKLANGRLLWPATQVKA